MAKFIRKNGATSNIFRVKILDSTKTTGAGLTGLTNSSAGLIISTITDNEATVTRYTNTGGTVQTITTLGTYAAPSANNCRFKEVDATNHPGMYEIQLADARFAVASAKLLYVTISGPTGAAETDVEIQLDALDLDTASTAQTGDTYALANGANGFAAIKSDTGLSLDIDQGDEFTDTTTDPTQYQQVIKKKSTATERVRKKLYEKDGTTKITAATQIVGQRSET